MSHKRHRIKTAVNPEWRLPKVNLEMRRLADVTLREHLYGGLQICSYFHTRHINKLPFWTPLKLHC